MTGHQTNSYVRYKALRSKLKQFRFQRDPPVILMLNNELTDAEFGIPKSDVGLLTIKTFDRKRLGGTDRHFEKFLARCFSKLNEKNVKNLIIDLRDNAGGQDEHGPLLYSYLTSKPFRYYRSIESTSKIFEKQENTPLSTLQPQGENFGGKVLILINGLSFSITAEFCAIAKSNERAVFIGEETGSGYYGNTSGQTMKIEVPNSCVQVIIQS